MSRTVNVNDPGSWNEDDRAYLTYHPEMVPEQYRAELIKSVPSSPVQTVEEASSVAAAMAELTQFVRENFPDEEGSTVEVVIRLLSDDESETQDEYESWKAAELKNEAVKREIDVSGMRTRVEIIEALRAHDRSRLAAE